MTNPTFPAEFHAEASASGILNVCLSVWDKLSVVTRQCIIDTLARKKAGQLTREQAIKSMKMIREMAYGDLSR